jgi:hypothetical protein
LTRDDVPPELDSDEGTEDTGESHEVLHVTRPSFERALTKKIAEILPLIGREVYVRLKNTPLAEIEAGLWGDSAIEEGVRELIPEFARPPRSS